LDDASIGALSGVLIILIVMSAFFSASETGMMALNRYRLNHLADNGHRGARIARQLLDQPDRLLGTILFGNNLVNFAAASVTTIIAFRLFDNVPISFVTFMGAIVILVFAEIPPKTVASIYPERIAFPAAYLLKPLIFIAHPVVWIVNKAGGIWLRLLRIPIEKRTDTLGLAELRSVLQDKGIKIPESHQRMLLRILELESMTVEDVMVPRSDIEAIDLDDDWDEIIEQLATSHHTRVPVYRGTLDNVVGELHLRKVLHLTQRSDFDKDGLLKLVKEPHFLPEDSKLTQQLLDLQNRRQPMGLVVDEYGDLTGLITLEEILEEIVGDFTNQIPGIDEDVRARDDGSFLVDGSANVRDLNRRMGWDLPLDGPKTLNGLILEALEDIPKQGNQLTLGRHAIEILRTRDNTVIVARVRLQGDDFQTQINS